MSQFSQYPAPGVLLFSTFAAFPASAPNGQLALALNTDFLYVYNTTSVSWVLIAGSSSVLTVGTIDSQTPSANGAVITLNSLVMQSASATAPGLVNTTTQTFAGQKTFSTGLTGTLTGSASLNVLTSALGNLTDAGTDGITVTGGTGAVVGAVSLSQHVADTTHNGYLSSTDWNTFNGKQATVSIGSFNGTSTAAGLDITANVLALHAADGTNPGAVSTTTQTFAGQKTFSTGLTGTLTGAASLNVLTSALGNLTDAGTDGIVVTGGTGATVGSVSLAQHVADTTHNGYLSSTDWNTFNGKQAAGNYITALTGDGTASGPGSVALTLATVNGNVGSFGSSTAIPSFTVNGKGLITEASTNVVIAPAGTLTGTVLAANVVTSSLTTVGTIGTGIWQGTAVGISFGGTGQTTKAAAFDALSPMTTGGDLIYGGASGTGTRLANGSSGQVLTSAGTTLAPTWSTPTTGTVTSVAASGPTGIATWSAAVTTSGTLTQTLSTQNAGTFLAGPTSGSAATPTFRALQGPTVQKFTSGSGTYTTAAGVLWIRVTMVGGGAGGAGSGSADGTAATNGGNTTFGSSLLVANGGVKGTRGNDGGAGGSASLGSGPIGTALSGGYGGAAAANGTSPTTQISGGHGGVSPLGGAGAGGSSAGASSGLAAITNSGSGGGGGVGVGTNTQSGSGGGPGGYVNAIITAPAASYSYAVGAAGSGGGAGTSGFAGGNGGSGYIIVEERYQ